MTVTRVHARNDYYGTEAERDALSLPADAVGTRFTDADGKMSVWLGTAWLELCDADLDFHIDGALAAATGVGPTIVITRACTIEKVVIYVKTTGSAGSTVLDVNKNSASIYPAATKPTVAHDDADGIDSRVPDTTACAAGDLLDFDLDSVATGAVGLDIRVVRGA